MSAPSQNEFIELGAISEAQGLRGQVKVRPHATDPVALLSSKLVWLSLLPRKDASALSSPGQPTLTQYVVKSAKMHSGNVVLALEGISDRDQALALKGARVLVTRDAFPKEEKDTYYWVDLIGCTVLNEEGVNLGTVDEIAEYGAHPVMTVGKELIPFVPDLVKSVDLQKGDLKAKGTIIVAWQPNWSQ